MSTDGRDARPVHRRIAKACEPCRRRKAKCDGKFPACTLCVAHGDRASCHYRKKPRTRVSRKGKADGDDLQSDGLESSWSPGDKSQLHLTSETPSSAEANTAGHDNPTAHMANESQADRPPLGVNAAQSNSQLYYGPSSNFAFLQHIHQTFARPDTANPGKSSSLDRFKYRDRFFAPAPVPGSSTEKGHSLFLPEALAREFLGLFLDSFWNLTPFLNKAVLTEMLRNLYTGDSRELLSSSDTAIILLCMASGATATKHTSWVDILMERALAAVPGLDMVITLRSVQISLLVLQTQISCGRHNMAYIQAGSAARKAFAAGLHRDTDYEMSQFQSPEERETRRLTFWGLVFMERWLSFWLGRPSAMGEASIKTPLPATSPFVRAMGELSKIICQANHLLYEDSRAPPGKLWQSAQQIQLELYAFQRRMEPILGFKLDQDWETAVITPDRLFLTCHFYHTTTMIFRPFLIMAATRSQRTVGGREQEKCSVSADRGDETAPDDMWWLPEASEVAVNSARMFIRFFTLSVTNNPLIRGLSFTAAYAENAACLVFFDSLQNGKSKHSNGAALKQALEGLKRMTQITLVPGVVATVEQIISELDQIDADGRKSIATSRPLDPLSIGQYTQPPLLSASNPFLQTQMQPFNDHYYGDFFDINWSYTLPYDLGFEQGLFAPNLGDYFDAQSYPAA